MLRTTEVIIFYVAGEQGFYAVDNFMELEDVEFVRQNTVPI